MTRIRKAPEKAVLLLLNRLIKVKEYAIQAVAEYDDHTCNIFASKFECIESTLQNMPDPHLQIKKFETMVMDQLDMLDQELDDKTFIFPSAVARKLKCIEEEVGRLKSLVSMFEQSVSESPGGIDSENQPLNDGDDGQETPDLAVDDEISESEAMYFLSETFHCLENSRLKKCLALLTVFPENEAIKKRPLIYWWIGEGLVTEREDATAHEVGEELFQELLDMRIIKPTSTRNSFTVYPSIRRVLAKENGFLSPEETPHNAFKRVFLWRGKKNIDVEKEKDVVTVYNMNKQYLGSKLDLLSRTHKLLVLQMGRWQDSVTHHIEVQDSKKLLETLGSQKQLKYVSLRGISRIETLPQSIRKLKKLLILDLKACHNLDKLPEEVAELRSLTHLDVSECYLLESMPKGLRRLSNLQVLKGFVVSKSYQINDLAQLPHLRKLSIHMVHMGDEQGIHMGNWQSNEQLGRLGNFKALLVLTISWGKRTYDYNVVSLPKTLVKLDLRSVPFPTVPKWMKPSELPNLEKLYIKGGGLMTLTNDDVYHKVKFIRLIYLEYLHNSPEELVAMFPNYQRLQKMKSDMHGSDILLTRAGYTS